MGDDVRAIISEAFDLTFATSPSDPGRTVTLTDLYGIDGSNTGTDESNEDLVFPVAMAEGAPGVYSAPVRLSSTGVFWARFSVDGSYFGSTLVRVVSVDHPFEEAIAEVSHTVALVAPLNPSSVQLTITDTTGASAGLDANALAIVWPQPMTQVPGYSDSWYFSPIVFSEGGRYQAQLAPDAGPISNDVVLVFQPASTMTLSHFNGWEPDVGLIPQSWVSISYIRRWTGWSSSSIGDEDVRELRRMAIESFIQDTNAWAPAWTGTWYGLRGQGRRLYLPVPLLLPTDGGTDPVVEYREPWGDQTSVESISNSFLAWRVRGRHVKQPFVEQVHGRGWDHTLDVAITGTFGFVGLNKTLPLRIQQTIVGLIRWHSLSLGVDADDARDQATLNRIAREGTRDSSAMYHDSAIGMGLTGDRTIDRMLAEMTIPPGPWIQKGGDLPSGGRA